MFSRKAEKVLFCNYRDLLWPQPGPAPREGPACLSSAAANPATVLLPPTQPLSGAPPDPWGPRSQCLPVGESGSPQQPSHSSLGTKPHRAAPAQALWAVLCRGTARWPSVPHPRGGHGTGILLELSHHSSPTTEGQGPAPFCPLDTGEERALVSLAPRASCGDWVSWALVQEKPPCHWLTPFPLPWTLWGLVKGAVLAAPSLQPSSCPPTAGLGTTERHCGLGHIGQAWPQAPPAPAWVRPHLPGTTASQQGGWVTQQRSLAKASPPCPGQSVCPQTWPSSPTAHVLSVPLPTGTASPTACPPCQSRCHVRCRAFSPGAGSAPSPLVYSLPGRFFADF